MLVLGWRCKIGNLEVDLINGERTRLRDSRKGVAFYFAVEVLSTGR